MTHTPIDLSVWEIRVVLNEFPSNMSLAEKVACVLVAMTHPDIPTVLESIRRMDTESFAALSAKCTLG